GWPTPTDALHADSAIMLATTINTRRFIVIVHLLVLSAAEPTRANPTSSHARADAREHPEPWHRPSRSCDVPGGSQHLDGGERGVSPLASLRLKLGPTLGDRVI